MDLHLKGFGWDKSSSMQCSSAIADADDPLRTLQKKLYPRLDAKMVSYINYGLLTLDAIEEHNMGFSRFKHQSTQIYLNVYHC